MPSPTRPGPALDIEGTLFLLGKGGVGKSVVAAGLAALAVRQGRRTLLVRLGESIYKGADRSRSPVMSKDGFEVVDLEPQFAMDEYVDKVVRVRALSSRITGSEVYRKFFAAAPGLPELVLLGRIQAFSNEAIAHGASRWQSIVVDCPSSGHGLLMLETPFAAFRAVSIGPFSRLASQIMEWLKAEVRIGVVAIPEEMAVVEAIEFAEDLKERTGLAPSLVILNRMRQDVLSPEARQAIADSEVEIDSADQALLDCGARVQRRSRLEAFHLKRLSKGLGMSPIILRELANTRPATIAKALSAESA
ncbi:MAG: ArsA-related P-loop ATPase [Vicinamibacteria bacterium]